MQSQYKMIWILSGKLKIGFVLTEQLNTDGISIERLTGDIYSVFIFKYNLGMKSKKMWGNLEIDNLKSMQLKIHLNKIYTIAVTYWIILW